MTHGVRVLVMAALLAGAPPTAAQPQRPRAELTAVARETAFKPGTTATVTLKVRLPKNVHVQSNKPRDPLLIPTVLTIDAPAGVTVERITYPLATELAQTGRRDKLVVYGPEFEIEVRLALADAAPPGDLVVPAQLRYQACNEAVCFPPARASAQWALRVADLRY
jgi:DsbC/DsbD-like thiol-disulfide interchange protein